MSICLTLQKKCTANWWTTHFQWLGGWKILHKHQTDSEIEIITTCCPSRLSLLPFTSQSSCTIMKIKINAFYDLFKTSVIGAAQSLCYNCVGTTGLQRYFFLDLKDTRGKLHHTSVKTCVPDLICTTKSRSIHQLFFFLNLQDDLVWCVYMT